MRESDRFGECFVASVGGNGSAEDVVDIQPNHDSRALLHDLLQPGQCGIAIAGVEIRVGEVQLPPGQTRRVIAIAVNTQLRFFADQRWQSAAPLFTPELARPVCVSTQLIGFDEGACRLRVFAQLTICDEKINVSFAVGGREFKEPF